MAIILKIILIKLPQNLKKKEKDRQNKKININLATFKMIFIGNLRLNKIILETKLVTLIKVAHRTSQWPSDICQLL